MTGIAHTVHPDQWTETDRVAWSIDVPGEGWSCPVLWGNRVFLTAAVPVTGEDNRSATQPEEYSGGGGRRRDDLTKVPFRFQVICVDAKTGEEIWRQTAREGRPRIPRHSSNTYATETPVTDGERVIASFGMNGLYCFDLSGELLWEQDLGSYEMRAGWGTSSSPALFDGKLFVQVDNEQQSFLVALNANTGEEVWRVVRDENSQYSSPIVWKNRLRAELIVGGMHYRSYDPDTGELLWQLDMEKGRVGDSLGGRDRLYVGTEFRNRGGADDGGGFCSQSNPAAVVTSRLPKVPIRASSFFGRFLAPEYRWRRPRFVTDACICSNGEAAWCTASTPKRERPFIAKECRDRVPFGLHLGSARTKCSASIRAEQRTFWPGATPSTFSASTKLMSRRGRRRQWATGPFSSAPLHGSTASGSRLGIAATILSGAVSRSDLHRQGDDRRPLLRQLMKIGDIFKRGNVVSEQGT